MKPWLAQRWMDRKNAPALSSNGVTLTYAELAGAAQRRAALLKDRHIARGSVVSIYTGPEAQNSLDFVFWAHAVFWLGATLVPLHAQASAAELDFQLSGVAADLLLIHESAPELESTMRDTPILRVGESADHTLPPAGTECAPADIDGEDRLTILFTSGTSGAPKAVPLTVQNHLASASASAMRLGLCEDDHWLCCLPLCHIGGLAILLRSAIYGTSFELVEGFRAPQILEVLAEKPVTLASFVPTMLYRLLAEATGDITSKLRAVLIGGGPMEADLLRDARRRGLPVLPTYGMTEMCSQLATLSPHTAPEIGANSDRLDTAGQPLDGVELRIERADRSLCNPAETGRILARGPMLTPGYLPAPQGATHPDETADPRFVDGWFITGDMGRLDEDGFLHIEHRISDLIVTGGENVDPNEVCELLRQVDGVRDIAVVGVDDAQWGQKVCAAVVPGDRVENHEFLLRKLDQHCRANLSPFKVPRDWRIVDEIPRTTSGKTHRSRTRELFAPAGSLEHPDAAE